MILMEMIVGRKFGRSLIKNVAEKITLLPVGIIFTIVALMDLSCLTGIIKNRFFCDKIISVLFWICLSFSISTVLIFILSSIFHEIEKTKTFPNDELEKNNENKALKPTVNIMMVASFFWFLVIATLGYKGMDCNPVALVSDTLLLFNGLGFSVYFSLRLFQKYREKKYIENLAF